MKFRIVFTSIFLLIFTVACFAADQGTIFIVRHGEKASSPLRCAAERRRSQARALSRADVEGRRTSRQSLHLK